MRQFLSPQPLLQGPGLFLIRILTGFFLIYHGREIFDSETMNGYLDWDTFKTGSGKFLVYAGKSAELLSGILLTLGWLTRVGALLAAGTLAYIAFFVGHGKVWYEDQHPFLFVLLAGVFFFTGPGSWSIDGWRWKNLSTTN